MHRNPDPREDPKSRSLYGGSYKAALVVLIGHRAPNYGIYFLDPPGVWETLGIMVPSPKPNLTASLTVTGLRCRDSGLAFLFFRVMGFRV